MRSLVICTLLTQYCSGDKIERNEIGGVCSANGREERSILSFFWGGGHQGKRPLGRSRRRWEDIKMDLQEVGCGVMDWI